MRDQERVYPVVVPPFALNDHRLPSANPPGLESENALRTQSCGVNLKCLMQPCSAPASREKLMPLGSLVRVVLLFKHLPDCGRESPRRGSRVPEMT